MKTAISLPQDDFERFDRIAASKGISRSEFFRVAAARYADELDGGDCLAARARRVLDAVGQPSGDGTFLDESERLFSGIDRP